MPSLEPVAPTNAEVASVDREHVFHSWSAQLLINPMPVAGGAGCEFWDHEGNRWLDFSSQLVNLNLGHQHPKVIAAIVEQAQRLCTVAPSFANQTRNEAARLISAHAPDGLDRVFFTNGGAEATENAIRMARAHTGRSKVLAAYRSYHGGTAAAMALTGEPRRWGSEPSISGVVHFHGPYPYRSSFGATSDQEEADRAIAHLAEVIQFEGPELVAAIILETIVGTNGILIPPDGYIAGVREICDRHDILMVADEVMAGFGRTGNWFAVNEWGVTPDLMTMAKGLTSSYLPLGAVAMRHGIAEQFETKMFYGGLTYSSHPVSLAAALATISVYEEDGLIENARRLGPVMRAHHERLAAKHPSVGATRNLGLFGIIDLVRSHDPWTPMTPFNGTSDEMKAVGRFLRDNDVYTLIANNSIHTNPPLCITEDELAHGFEIIDAALDIADQAVTD